MISSSNRVIYIFKPLYIQHKLQSMIILSILLILYLIGILLVRHSYGGDIQNVAGFLLVILSSCYLLFHTVEWATATYDYNKFVAKRNAFISTLETARSLDNNIELAAIAKDISQWNQDLAEAQYQNSLFLLTDYIDDRVNNLTPIK